MDDGCPVTLCPGALDWLLGHGGRDRDDDEAPREQRWTLTTPVPVSGAG